MIASWKAAVAAVSVCVACRMLCGRLPEPIALCLVHVVALRLKNTRSFAAVTSMATAWRCVAHLVFQLVFVFVVLFPGNTKSLIFASCISLFLFETQGKLVCQKTVSKKEDEGLHCARCARPPRPCSSLLPVVLLHAAISCICFFSCSLSSIDALPPRFLLRFFFFFVCLRSLLLCCFPPAHTSEAARRFPHRNAFMFVFSFSYFFFLSLLMLR